MSLFLTAQQSSLVLSVYIEFLYLRRRDKRLQNGKRKVVNALFPWILHIIRICMLFLGHTID